jgi:LmbE family N-acetylglucosaminyl deacetylase
MGSPSPDHFVDVTDTYEAKLAALRAHASQTAHMDNLDEMLRGWLTANAVAAKLDTGRLAEAFTIIHTA